VQILDIDHAYWDHEQANIIVRFLVNGAEHGAHFKFSRPNFDLLCVAYFTDVDYQNTMDIQRPEGTDFGALEIAARSVLSTWTN
jgi:hypothetical protein